jgi:CO/xanthine dehydrogenase FAD-binding subunit
MIQRDPLPRRGRDLRAAYRKLRIRDTIDFPSMGAAVALRMNGKKLDALRISITAIDVVPIPMDEVTPPSSARS